MFHFVVDLDVAIATYSYMQVLVKKLLIYFVNENIQCV